MAFGNSKAKAKPKVTFEKFGAMQSDPNYEDKIGALFSSVSAGEIQELTIRDLKPYRQHAYRLYDGERKRDLVESIRQHGVLQPIIVRELRPGEYEILAGHNRTAAAREAGLERIPAIVKPYPFPDDQAEAIVHITNLMQRGFTELLPSEQAYVVSVAYSSLFSADKRKAIEQDLKAEGANKSAAKNAAGASSGIPQKSTGKVGREYGLSERTVARLLRIAKLCPELQQLLDEKSFGLYSGVALSYLSAAEQAFVADAVRSGHERVSMQSAERLKTLSERKNGQMSQADVRRALEENKRKHVKSAELVVPDATANRWFTPEQSKKERLSIIEAALAQYFQDVSKTEK